MQKKSLAKTLWINIGLFIGFLIVLDLLIISGWETRRFINYLKEDVFKKKVEYVDPRVALPNYKDASWAKEYFIDFNKLKDDNYKSYIGWRKTAFNSKYINIDSAGLRVTPQPEIFNDSVIHVTFLGGSTMWGTGAPDNGTIPALFAEEGGGKYQTQNFGESGYRAMQSYIFLILNFNKGLETDWVISYDGVNEAVGFLDYNTEVSTYAESRMRSKLKSKEGVSVFVKNLTYRNFFLGPIENTISRLKNKSLPKEEVKVILNDNRIDLVARTLLDGWLAMKDVSEKNNAQFLAVLQPNVSVGKPKIDHLTFDSYESLLMKTYVPLYNKVRELLVNDKKYSDLKNHVLDLSEVFDGQEIYYIDWCHVSPNGNEKVAKEIFKKMEKLIN